MAILKCKQCGGDIQATDKTYGTCESCGVISTLPNSSDEQKINLFNRANHLRRQNEFDKAVTAYENILNLDAASAEAHWGLVLSKYGIEYVEDPATDQRVPTCHRVQSDSILTDADYLSALKNAEDEYTKSLYERDAKEISDIQKGILAISSKEQSYDVFICYKETTDGGSRTKDSALAQELHYQLEKEGFRVFFSRISLESKLGRQYEPYIFNALNSAKVMLVVGTKPEHFNAVWVKNEWSRFLALMKRDRSRLLIPCYRDMDAYDLPEEMSMLQSQDMGKIGFAQDVIHGIKKVCGGGISASVKNGHGGRDAAATSPTAPGVESLMKRGWLFLEDSDWKQAEDYFNRVLDIDPEHAPAYIGKLCVELKVLNEADLVSYQSPLDKNPNYQKALRFASGDFQIKLTGYNQTIQERAEQEQQRRKIAQERIRQEEETERERTKQEKYDKLVQAKNQAFKEGEFQYLAGSLHGMNGYKDTKQLAEECHNQYRILRQQREEQEASERERKAEQARKERELQEERKRKEAERAAKEARAEKRRKIAKQLVRFVWPLIGLVLYVALVPRPQIASLGGMRSPSFGTLIGHVLIAWFIATLAFALTTIGMKRVDRGKLSALIMYFCILFVYSIGYAHKMCPDTEGRVFAFLFFWICVGGMAAACASEIKKGLKN